MKTIGIIIRKLDIDNGSLIGTRLDLFEVFNKFKVKIKYLYSFSIFL